MNPSKFLKVTDEVALCGLPMGSHREDCLVGWHRASSIFSSAENPLVFPNLIGSCAGSNVPFCNSALSSSWVNHHVMHTLTRCTPQQIGKHLFNRSGTDSFLDFSFFSGNRRRLSILCIFFARFYTVLGTETRSLG